MNGKDISTLNGNELADYRASTRALYSSSIICSTLRYENVALQKKFLDLLMRNA